MKIADLVSLKIVAQKHNLNLNKKPMELFEDEEENIRH